MTDQDPKSFQDRLVDARNEAIVQGANLYILGRQVMLATIGLCVMGIETNQTLLQRAVERGEIVEADAQKRLQEIQGKGGPTGR